MVRSVFPRRLREVTDPMTGFFAVRRQALDLENLNPIGFKILLEMLFRTPGLRIQEVPFTFAERYAGESKANAAEGIRFVRQLARLEVSRLLASRHTPRVTRILGFGLVGVSGILVNSLLMWFFADNNALGLNYLVAAAIATEGSTTWNFILIDRFVYREQRRGHVWKRFIGFAVMNNIVLLARLPIMAFLVERAGVNYLFANLITLLAAFAVRFMVSDRFIYRIEALSDSATEPQDTLMETAPRRPITHVADESEAVPAEISALESRAGTGYLHYRYRIHDLVTIGSEIPLRELDYFRDQAQHGQFDIEVTIGDVGPGMRRKVRLTTMSNQSAVRYEEHFGRLAANFFVSMGDDRIRIVVSPGLARSPHVVYTNIIEALLRFSMVDRGSMLLHSACVEIDGRGVMLSAKTDTGKTGTILRLVRDQGARFLSDDMTIISPDGTARCYPKPLTISNHTLRAVDPGDLSRTEWQILKLKSRVHSREGRSFGLRLAEMNLPIVSVNAFTQIVVPPPKYPIDRLVPTKFTNKTQIAALFVIERGPDGLTPIERDEALDELIVNTDDAYGFPPFSEFARNIVLGGKDYVDLRLAERSILRRATNEVVTWRLASNSFGWADEIPQLLKDPNVVPQVADSSRIIDLRVVEAEEVSPESLAAQDASAPTLS